MSLHADAVTQTFAILAKRGAGKTYTALVLVEVLLPAGAQVVIADPVGLTWACGQPRTARTRACRSS